MNTNEWRQGLIWGALATITMSILMIIGLTTGLSPMPAPIPMAVMVKILGAGVPKPLLMLLAITTHLGYGAFWAAALARWSWPITPGKGLALGLVLWLIMQILVLPFLDWGFFGSQITPKIAVATLVLHLVYGAMLGWLAGRNVEQTTETGETDAG